MLFLFLKALKKLNNIIIQDIVAVLKKICYGYTRSGTKRYQGGMALS